MSVIYGLVHTGGQPVEAGVLDAMSVRLNHWQADASANWRNGCAGLGHLMLFNTPESLNEKLPFFDSESNTTITADARIDNREELYTILHLHTADDRKLPDSTLILMLYNKYGKECINYIIGDFAFAIWDEKIQQLFCARDHMGVKPFFYYNDSNLFAFASEKKGILAIPQTNKGIDKDFFYNQLFWPPQQSATSTVYAHIRRLAPAHMLVYEADKKHIAISRYWTLDADAQLSLKNTKDHIDGLKHHFDIAVKCRLRTQFHLGSELSGGLDSSAIVGAAHNMDTSLDMYTFSSAEGKDDIFDGSERIYMDDVIRFNRVSHPVFITSNLWDDPLQEVDFCIEVNDGIEMWNPHWQIPIKKAAADHDVRTLLSGFPGDEMVTSKGKNRHIDLWHKGQYVKYIMSFKKKYLANFLAPFIPVPMAYAIHKLKNLTGLQDRITSSAFHIPFYHRYRYHDLVWQNAEFREKFKSYRHYLKAKLLKPQVGLRLESETRFGIYFRLEPRFPLADVRLTQFYLSMPDNLKYEGGKRRFAFRQAVKTYLPESVWLRDSKTGTMAPYRNITSEREKRKNATQTIVKGWVNADLFHIKNSDKVSPIHLDILRWFQKNQQK